MSASVWKFPLELTDVQDVYLPSNHRWLHVEMQNNVLCAWAWVDLDSPTETRTLAVVGTGNPAPSPDSAEFIGTALAQPFVWHVFASLTDAEQLAKMLERVAW